MIGLITFAMTGLELESIFFTAKLTNWPAAFTFTHTKSESESAGHPVVDGEKICFSPPSTYFLDVFLVVDEKRILKRKLD